MLKTKIDLRSDTITLPTSEMMETIPQTSLGDDILGEDPTVRKLEKKAARILGMEDALLVISGTMANQIALMNFSQRGQEVIVGKDSHMYNMESAGISALSQVQVRLVDVINGYYNPDNIEESISLGDIQKPKTALICLENTYDLNGGYSVTIDNMKEIREVANKYNIPIYLDGARIFNAATALDVKPKSLCDHVDAVQFCLTKGLGCPLGSILAGSERFIKLAKFNRQRLGGGMRQAGIIAAPAIYALDNMVERLKEDNKQARYLGKCISNNSNIKINEIQTNIVSLSIKHQEWNADKLIKYLREKNILVKKIGNHKIRMVIHYQITGEDIKYVISTLNNLFT